MSSGTLPCHLFAHSIARPASPMTPATRQPSLLARDTVKKSRDRVGSATS
jgi:hypothetical protein